MKLLPVLLFSASQAWGPTPAPPTSPPGEKCPSNTCWNEQSDGSCILDGPSCPGLAVTCDVSGMTVTFTDALYDSNADTMFEIQGRTDRGIACDVAKNSGTVTWSGALGSCGMTVEKTANNIVFKQNIAVGSFHHTGVNVNDPDGDAVRIFVEESRGTSIEFSCLFPLTASVTSDDVVITQDDVIDATIIGQGNWDDAFTLRFTTSNYNTAMNPASNTIGDTLYASVSFSGSNIPLQWFVSDCTVLGGVQGSLQVVKDSCYAEVVNAMFGGTRSGNENNNKRVTTKSNFQYNSFSFGTSSAESQVLRCGITFCLQNDSTAECNLSARSCPTSGKDAVLTYTTYGSSS